MGKIGWSATVFFFAIGAILATYGVQGVKMPQSLFISLITTLSLIASIAFVVIVRAGIKAIGTTEWQRRRIYRISGVPKSIPIGEQQISIFLQLGATRYIGSIHVNLVKEKGMGIVVPNDLGWVTLDKEKTNHSPGIRMKGEELTLFLKFNTKTQWNGWLKIGFGTEIGEVPYVHFPIAFR